MLMIVNALMPKYVQLRPRRDGHRAGAQAREAEGEALGTAEEKSVLLSKVGSNLLLVYSTLLL